MEREGQMTRVTWKESACVNDAPRILCLHSSSRKEPSCGHLFLGAGVTLVLQFPV